MVLAMMLSACGTQPAEPSPSPAETAAPAETEAEQTPEATEEVAQTNYPERPIQNVIPFGAGGGTDVWNRALMDAMRNNFV